MRYIYRLSDFFLDNSELVVSFRSLSRFDNLSFRVSIPYLNRVINEGLKGSNTRWRPLRLNGVSFDVYTSDLLELKNCFDFLTK